MMVNFKKFFLRNKMRPLPVVVQKNAAVSHMK
ncbi:hypothetical protein AF91_13580 [Lacticaseibacillus paracasei N1115]|uniref:Uncharacterized protein n=1 Tax=Lacticaseibacillus paracasei N1115 TaxID=1446494 RepID=A0A806LI24_LACPA|nr:hypothetical protein AF91_13580 [Lacticaseibacillus paracasei N1115]